MSATTVKIHENTKRLLDEFRRDNDSYDDVINKLVAETKSKNLIRELVEAYGSKAKEDKRINKEWSKTSSYW